MVAPPNPPHPDDPRYGEQGYDDTPDLPRYDRVPPQYGDYDDPVVPDEDTADHNGLPIDVPPELMPRTPPAPYTRARRRVDPNSLDAGAEFNAAAVIGDDGELDDADENERMIPRATGNDPTFGFLVALALSIGLTPLIPANADLRLTLSWMALAFFGVLAWLLGSTTRIGEEEPENLAWGFIFGLIVAVPMLLIGGQTLTTTVQLIFRTGIGAEGQILPLSRGVVLAMLVFVMPLAETLFFRGVMQVNRPFWMVGILATVWSMVLFVPALDVGTYPLVAVIISVALLTINLFYSYVRQRNGLAAAWICQIIVNIVLLFVPIFGL